MRVRHPLRTLYRIFLQKAPIEAQLIVTRRCNLSCGYCNEYDHHSPPIPLQTLQQRIDALHRLGVVNISLLGGEPLLHPHIADIVAYANRRAQVSITTNGYLLSETLIDKLNRAGLANMQISIDALHPDSNFYIQKTLKSIAPKLKRLRARAKFAIHAKIVLCEASRSEAVPMIDALGRMGIPVSVNLIHDGRGRLAIHGDTYLSIWDYSYRYAPLLAFAEYHYGRRLLQGERPDWHCRAGARFLYIDEFGNAQFCSQQRGQLNKPITCFTKEDLRKNYHATKGCEQGCTMFCVFRASLLDGSPVEWIHGLQQWIQMRLLLRLRPRFRNRPAIKGSQEPGFHPGNGSPGKARAEELPLDCLSCEGPAAAQRVVPMDGVQKPGIERSDESMSQKK